jgi:hypothetical protein
MRFDIVERIHLVEESRKRLRNAVQVFDEVSLPLLEDQSLIPYLKQIFCEITGESNLKGELREIFVFIVMYLYGPGKMEGVRSPILLRRSLAQALGIKAPSVLSRVKETYMLRYEVYFHDKADAIFAMMVNRLQKDGYL